MRLRGGRKADTDTGRRFGSHRARECADTIITQIIDGMAARFTGSNYSGNCFVELPSVYIGNTSAKAFCAVC